MTNTAHLARWAARPHQRYATSAAVIGALIPIVAAVTTSPARAIVVNCTTPACLAVTNPVSASPVFVDGKFSGVLTDNSIAEWSDITPLAFISAAVSGNQTPAPTILSDPRADSFVYTGVAPGIVAGDGNALYLAYDYHSRTNPFNPGGLIASVSFPIQLPVIATTAAGDNGRATTSGVGETQITVEIAATANAQDPFACQNDLGISATRTCTVVLPDGSRQPASLFGILGAADFGQSLIRPGDPSHLIVELEVPVLVSQATKTFPNANNGVYSPLPKFWGASATDNAGDPPISSSLVTIDPNTGITTTTPVVSSVPEPATLSVLGLGIVGLGIARRRRR